MDQNTASMPPIDSQPSPVPAALPKRSPLRLFVPILVAPALGLLFEYIFFRSPASDCDGLACAGTAILLVFVAWILIPAGFGVAGAVWYRGDRVFGAIAWLMLALVASVGVLYAVGDRLQPLEQRMEYIHDFEDCSERGYPVAESYPRQCRTPDGRIFLEELNNREVPDPNNATIKLPDGSMVTLVNGISTVQGPAGASDVAVTSYVGSQMSGDFNRDGVSDTSFVFTRSTGGTGTFTLLAVIVSGPDGWVTDSFDLGDRINYRSTRVLAEGELETYYLTHSPGEAFTDAPTLGVIRYFRVIDGELAEVPKPSSTESAEPRACSADAFECPDGTWVGRSGAHCEFVCP